jgi:hypothetical protein
MRTILIAVAAVIVTSAGTAKPVPVTKRHVPGRLCERSGLLHRNAARALTLNANVRSLIAVVYPVRPVHGSFTP